METHRGMGCCVHSQEEVTSHMSGGQGHGTEMQLEGCHQPILWGLQGTATPPSSRRACSTQL